MERYKVGILTDESGMNRYMGLVQDPTGEAVRYVDAAKKIYELEQQLAEAGELKADFKKAMKLLWKLLDTITKGE